MKNWDDLRYLAAVYKTGSMSSAARLLDTNPATVSRRLSRLGETLGFELFVKTPSGWAANERLGDLIDSITGFEQEIESYLNHCQNTSGGLRGRITIGVPPSLAGYVLYPGLRMFREAYPEIELVFHDQIFQESLGDHDLFITPVRPDHGRLVVRFLGKATTNLYCYPDSPRTGEWIGLIRFHEKMAAVEHARALMGGREPTIRVATIREIATASRLTRLPGLMHHLATVDDLELELFDADVPAPQAPIYLCFHETRRKDPVLQQVADWVAELFSAVDRL